MKTKPESVNILGIEYRIAYVEKPSDVDIHGRASCWGQIDYWTRTIRIYDNEMPMSHVWQILWHEILHGIGEVLSIDWLKGAANDDKHDDLDRLAVAISDIGTR